MNIATRIFTCALAGVLLGGFAVEAKEKPGKRRKAAVAKADVPILQDGRTIIATMYTVSGGVMKMTAILDFQSERQGKDVALEIKKDGKWQEAAKSQLILEGHSAHFRVEGWDQSQDVAYRVRHGKSVWPGTIRHDPVEKETIVVAGFTGNAGGNTKEDIVRHVTAHNPDLLVFTGDQVYGRNHLVNFPKNFCLPFRELLRDTPSILLPDDHDVGQGNLWGDGGKNYSQIDYTKMVQRVQTAHMPDPYDPTPVANGIGVYYSSFRVGRVGIAIVEDRKFKSNYKDFWSKGSVVKKGDPDFSAAKVDDPKAVLYGKRQLKFLDEWSADWMGQDQKLVVSQTVLAGTATHIRRSEGKPILADLDSNGWSQSGRNRALNAIRRGFATVLCGDQHLATITQHGIDDWGDAGYALCVPSIQNFWPRYWMPGKPGANHIDGMPPYTGNYSDGFDNKFTVWAAANPGPSGHEPAKIHDKAPGYGIVRFDCETGKITMECWPRYADPKDPSTGGQYPGWPKTISLEENYGRKAVAYLPTIEVVGIARPVIQVIDESNDEILYTIRAKTNTWRPKVFAKGTYTIRTGDPDHGKMVTKSGVPSVPENSKERLRISAKQNQ
jgi:hypothetical protein